MLTLTREVESIVVGVLLWLLVSVITFWLALVLPDGKGVLRWVVPCTASALCAVILWFIHTKFHVI